MMSKIRPNIYIGNYLDAQDFTNLHKEGITAILNVASDINDQPTGAWSIRQVKVGLEDYDEVNKEYMKNLSIEILSSMIKNGEKVLVHCAAGLSRAVWTISRYIEIYEGRSIENVFKEIKKKRPEIIWGPLFDEKKELCTNWFNCKICKYGGHSVVAKGE